MANPKTTPKRKKRTFDVWVNASFDPKTMGNGAVFGRRDTDKPKEWRHWIPAIFILFPTKSKKRKI